MPVTPLRMIREMKWIVSGFPRRRSGKRLIAIAGRVEPWFKMRVHLHATFAKTTSQLHQVLPHSLPLFIPCHLFLLD